MNSIATCCCGHASIEVQGKPLVNSICHCNDCKKRTGSAFGISVYVKYKQIVKLCGETTIYKIETGTAQERHFCVSCGTTLYWQTANFPKLTGIAGGCFNNINDLEPEYNFRSENMCAWLAIPDNWKTTIAPETFQ